MSDALATNGNVALYVEAERGVRVGYAPDEPFAGEGAVLTADDLRWLQHAGIPAALQALGAAPKLRQPRGRNTPPDAGGSSDGASGNATERQDRHGA